MTDREYILNIPEPCTQDWHQMLPGDTGRFCTHCSKTVIDFRGLTDVQIVDLLEQNKGGLCGRLKTEQLNRPISAKGQVTRSRSRLKEIFAALLLFAGTRFAGASPSKPPQVVVSLEKNAFTESVGDDNETTQRHTLTGTVIDSAYQEPIVTAVVRNKTSNVCQLTDLDGNFSIEAAEGETIEISYIAHKTLTYVVHGFDHKNLIMAPHEIRDLGGVIVMTKKAALKYRIRRFFGMKNR